jgi:hypothetical protein
MIVPVVPSIILLLENIGFLTNFARVTRHTAGVNFGNLPSIQ